MHLANALLWKLSVKSPQLSIKKYITLPVGCVPSILNFRLPVPGPNLPPRKNLYDALRCKPLPSGLWIHKWIKQLTDGDREAPFLHSRRLCLRCPFHPATHKEKSISLGHGIRKPQTLWGGRQLINRVEFSSNQTAMPRKEEPLLASSFRFLTNFWVWKRFPCQSLSLLDRCRCVFGWVACISSSVTSQFEQFPGGLKAPSGQRFCNN